MPTTLTSVLEEVGLGDVVMAIDDRGATSVVWLSSHLEDPVAALCANATPQSMPFVIHPETGKLVRRLTIDARERWNCDLLRARLRGERAGTFPFSVIAGMTVRSDDGRLELGRHGRLTIATAAVPALLSAALFPAGLRPATWDGARCSLERVSAAMLAVSGATDDRFHFTREPDAHGLESAVLLPEVGLTADWVRTRSKRLLVAAEEDRHLVELQLHERFPIASWSN